MYHLRVSLAVAVSIAGSVLAAKTGYFESESCTDTSGFEQCYEDADLKYTNCVNEYCKDQNIYCMDVCSCVQTQDQLDCAGAHCWNQASPHH